MTESADAGAGDADDDPEDRSAGGGGVSIERLADKLYRLMLSELRVERQRGTGDRTDRRG